MPPSASADNGGFAWMVTIRPKGQNFTTDLVDSVRAYIRDKLIPDHHLMVMEKGNHLHCAIFLHDPKQRSNLISMFLNNPLKDYDEEEKKNFRRYDRNLKTGAVINMTTLQMVSAYLSGEHEGKEEDEYEVISEDLPSADDISELEEYLPAINGLKRKRQTNVWFSNLAEEFREKYPDIEVMTERIALDFLQEKMFVENTMEIIVDQRILRSKIRCFIPFFNKEKTHHYLDYKSHTIPNWTNDISADDVF